MPALPHPGYLHHYPLRLRGPGLACRRLRQAANAPHLNTSARPYLQPKEVHHEAGKSRLISFCTWLAARGAGSVQRLTLMVGCEFTREKALSLGSALQACGGTLQRARLSLSVSLLTGEGSWAVPLRRLRVLDLDGRGPDNCQLSCSLAPLSQLERLSLDRIRLATARLPPSLTGLQLDYDPYDTMPPQV